MPFPPTFRPPLTDLEADVVDILREAQWPDAETYTNSSDLCHQLYGDRTAKHRNCTRQVILSLRRKGAIIENIHGVGYRLVKAP